MVWQDFMYACAEAPDDQQWFLQNAVTEAEYQVKRLRNHPSVAVWCGGNESSSSHRYSPNRPGQILANYYLRGVVQALTKNTPYVICSPHSRNDFGQIPESGETHWSTWPRKIGDNYGDFRERLATSKAVFNSEVCLQGPSPMESLLKYVTEEDIWPPNDVMDYHVVHHPCNPKVHPRYVISQLKMANEIIGECNNARQFVANGMMAHAEMVRAELTHYRTQRFKNSGALLWMYNEPWPCSNWAIVDYYGYLKAAYFAARRVFEPITTVITKPDENYHVYVINDGTTDVIGPVVVQYMDINGKLHWQEEYDGLCLKDKVRLVTKVAPEDIESRENSFLRVNWRLFDRELSFNYFVDLWKDVAFEIPDFEIEELEMNQRCDDGHVSTIRILAKNYSRCIYMDCKGMDVRDVTSSDNYFDLVPNESKEINIVTKDELTGYEIRSLLEDRM